MITDFRCPGPAVTLAYTGISRKSIPECAGFVHGAIPFDEEDVAGLKCAPKTGRENGGAFRTCTHALAECFSLHWPSNSAGVKYPSEE